MSFGKLGTCGIARNGLVDLEEYPDECSDELSFCELASEVCRS